MLELTPKRLANTGFMKLYQKIFLGEKLTESEKIKYLSIAVILSNQKNHTLNLLSYRMTLAYGNLTNDFKPLYDLAINSGLMPVASAIRKSTANKNSSFFSSFIDCYTETYSHGSNIYTEQQFLLNDFFQSNIESNVSVIAPTSYGKSELIISLLNKIGEANVCIIVPSKSLVSQTKRRIINADIEWLEKVVTHPDMCIQNANGNVFVLTQERLSRILHDNKDLVFDCVFVDEAHNILENDDRNILLASVLCIISTRSRKTSFKFLTPFLVDHCNLLLRHANFDIENFKISEYIKSERLYVSDFRKNKRTHRLYDQFFNKFIEYDDQANDYYSLILKKSLNKNIIYFNRPKSIEAFCLDFINKLPNIKCDLIESACKEIERYTSTHYKLIRCLRKGVMYHHGSIPDVIKSYIEHVFSSSNQLRYLVTSSTLLEGVNLPIERLFILENKKGPKLLSPSQLKNLIGRVGRFSEVFGNAERYQLNLLEPSIYLIGTDKFTPKADLEGFYSRSMNINKEIKETPTNTLLKNTEINQQNVINLQAAEIRLENLERGSIDDYRNEYARTTIGEILFSNNTTEIDIFSSENEIQSLLDSYKEKYGQINTPNETISVIAECFVKFVEESSLSRLSEERAQNFYSMFLDWKVRSIPFNQMVAMMVAYWEKLDPKFETLVYVGKWGDRILGDGYLEHWTDINSKSLPEKINLAIVRIKEEEDFFDYSLARYIDVLNDYNLIEKNFYLTLKYGTTDEHRISFIKEGFSRSLSELVMGKYQDTYSVDEQGNISVDGALLTNMRANQESNMLIFEASQNVKE